MAAAASACFLLEDTAATASSGLLGRVGSGGETEVSGGHGHGRYHSAAGRSVGAAGMNKSVGKEDAPPAGDRCSSWACEQQQQSGLADRSQSSGYTALASGGGPGGLVEHLRASGSSGEEGATAAADLVVPGWHAAWHLLSAAAIATTTPFLVHLEHMGESQAMGGC
jgi:hypothetical protein